MISHEVNNTTAGITSTLDTLESTFSGMEDMEDVCEVLRVSIERCYSMSHFITNFADVVRIPEPQSRPQELNQVVSACKRFMETVCQNRNIEIVMDLSEESPVVNLDNSLFEQVLVNIIKNAAESIERDGKIYIRTTVRPTCLEIADTDKKILEDYGVWAEKSMYGRKYMGVLRTTFIIDEQGIIERVITKVNTKNAAEQILKK